MTIGLKSFVLFALTCATVCGGPVDSQAQLAAQAEQLMRAGDAKSAMLILARASSEPSTAPGEDLIGFIYAAAGQQDEAITHFRKSIQKAPDFAAAHYHLGVVLWLKKDQANALQELQSAVRFNPNVIDYRYRLGAAYIETGSNDKAVTELKAAVDLDANRADVWQQLGLAEQRTNDLASAVDAYGKAVALSPKDHALRDSYAQLLIATRQPDHAIAEAETVLSENQWDLEARSCIGHAYLRMGDFAKAEKAYREILDIDANSTAGHYDLGIALKMQDQLEAAQKEFQKAIDLEPSLPESHYTLGITDWQLGDFAGTIAQMKAALAIRPNYAEAHYMLGIAMKQSGDLDGAVVELRESVRLDPTTPGPYNTLGQILRIKGDKAGSEQAFAQGAKLKADKDKQLASTLDQGMRGGMMPKPIDPPKADASKPGPQ
jgi:tetratricopeptide (TPR) repeat protein